jgi:hypothetical protein
MTHDAYDATPLITRMLAHVCARALTLDKWGNVTSVMRQLGRLRGR